MILEPGVESSQKASERRDREGGWTLALASSSSSRSPELSETISVSIRVFQLSYSLSRASAASSVPLLSFVLAPWVRRPIVPVWIEAGRIASVRNSLGGAGVVVDIDVILVVGRSPFASDSYGGLAPQAVATNYYASNGSAACVGLTCRPI